MKTKAKSELDKFYTNRDVVRSIIKEVNLDDFDLVIEPSAGDGAFVENISHPNLVALDILPEGDNIQKQNWFEYEIPNEYKKVLIIGNPPFGQNNDLSADFLKHSFSFGNVDTVAFVLPNVYRKHTMQKFIPDNFYINKIIDMNRNSFTLNGEPYHVPCSFFLISKDSSTDLRQNISLKSKDFTFGTKNDYDFFIFGAAPKKVIDAPNKNNRGYYIKANIDVDVLKSNFRNVNWRGHSSANGGVYWLTKVDIIENYVREIGK